MQMSIDSWLEIYKKAFELSGQEFSEARKSLLFNEYSKHNYKKEELQESIEIADILISYFFYRATKGDVFGSLKETYDDLGESVEKRYGYSKGPFINLARCYHTFRFEVDRIEEQYWKLYFFQILRFVDNNIASVFFPTAHPAGMPIFGWKSKQKQFLSKYAPEINSKAIFSRHPLVIRENKSKRFLLILLVVALFTVLFLIFR